MMIRRREEEKREKNKKQHKALTVSNEKASKNDPVITHTRRK
jgi:hypothetical protein